MAINKSRENKPRIGRPPDYKPDEYPCIARSLCLLGATNAELAKAFGKAISTIERWLSEHKDFNDAVKEGREVADAAVAMSLYRRAIGFTHETVKVLQFQGTPVYAPYTERILPDVTACIFWLKNRRPDLWRDAHRHEVAAVSYAEVDAAKKSAAAELRVWREDASA